MRIYLNIFSKLISSFAAILCCLYTVSDDVYAASALKLDMYGHQTTTNTIVSKNYVTINNEITTDQTTITDSNSTMTVTSGTFEKIADEPGPREGHVAAAYNYMIWSIAGVNDFGPAPPVRTYNPKTNSWNEVAASQAPFGEVHFHSGCQVYETVYMYVDFPESGNAGLYSYNMETNQWSDLTTAPGLPPHSILFSRNGAWVYDPDDNLCILTGGFWNDVGEPLSEVFVYDPVANKWLDELPNFTTKRIDLAAWIVGSGPDRKLCIAGGYIDSDSLSGLTEEQALELHKTTQCLPHGASTWNDENADLGPLPEFASRMGYAKRRNCQGKEELWLVGGVDWVFDGWSVYPWRDEDWIPVHTTFFFDTQTSAWVKGPSLTSGASVNCEAVVLDNELFKTGGSTVDWDSSAKGEKLVPEEQCVPPPNNKPKSIAPIYLLLHKHGD